MHGRPEGPKLAVLGLLRQITSLDPVILHDKPNQGRTIIEKFEDYAEDAAFAVVVLTADDVGGLASGTSRSPRARQNVVFEFGFFVGALGRNRVAILHEDGVELPSDVDGLLYIRLDEAGGWKLLLAKELRAAKIPVELRSCFRESEPELAGWARSRRNHDGIAESNEEAPAREPLLRGETARRQPHSPPR